MVIDPVFQVTPSSDHKILFSRFCPHTATILVGLSVIALTTVGVGVGVWIYVQFLPSVDVAIGVLSEPYWPPTINLLILFDYFE